MAASTRNTGGPALKFRDYYNQVTDDMADMEWEDDFECDEEADRKLRNIPTQNLIAALIEGSAGVADAGQELERRGALDLVPRDDWGA
jgi:hypothetical protein